MPLLVGATAASGRAASDLELARELLSDPRYQQSLTAPPREWALPLGSLRLPFVDVQVPAPLLLALLALLVVLLVAWWAASERARDGAADEVAPPAPDPRSDVSFESAARLANAGDHVTAVHMLLLLALQQAGRVTGREASRHQTSRELVRSLTGTVSRERQDALHELIRTVEWSWFGGRQVGAEEYERALGWCRAWLGRVT